MEFTSPPAIAADPGAFLIEQTPAYIANLVALRNELATRQGALSAAEKTVALQREAQLALDNAREQAEQLLTDANAKLADAKKRNADANAKGRQLDTDRVALEQREAQMSKALNDRERVLLAKADELNEKEIALQAKADELAGAQVELDQKVRALQARVAALTL
jgi:chromosome segregation ATPase